MKIAVCASMTFSPEMLDLEKKLKSLGHEVVLPAFTDHYATLNSKDAMHFESAHNKVEHNLIRGYFETIKECDAVLVYNPKKRDIEHYIGGNTFLEMGFAHVLNKPIFMYFPVPDMLYRDEIEAMKPIVINGDLERIVSSR